MQVGVQHMAEQNLAVPGAADLLQNACGQSLPIRPTLRLAHGCGQTATNHRP